jgi:hypothetical protein
LVRGDARAASLEQAGTSEGREDLVLEELNAIARCSMYYRAALSKPSSLPNVESFTNDRVNQNVKLKSFRALEQSASI